MYILKSYFSLINNNISLTIWLLLKAFYTRGLFFLQTNNIPITLKDSVIKELLCLFNMYEYRHKRIHTAIWIVY